LVETKVDKQEMTHMLAHKISFEDMKGFVEQNIRNTLQPQLSEMEKEIKRLQKRIDESNLNNMVVADSAR
jgi:hypothetical protein